MVGRSVTEADWLVGRSATEAGRVGDESVGRLFDTVACGCGPLGRVRVDLVRRCFLHNQVGHDPLQVRFL